MENNELVLAEFDAKLKELEADKDKLQETIVEKVKKITFRINGLHLARKEFEKKVKE